MAGMQDLVNQVAMSQRPQQPTAQFTPEMVQAILASQAQPTLMAPQFGASRFLTGPMQIPMTYTVDVPAYTPFSMTPGDFRSFASASDSGKNPVSFNPSTGTYSTL
jgi:hypothetical protein